MAFAFLDFDNTIIHGDAGPLFGAELFKQKKRMVESSRHGPKRAAAKTAMWTQILPYLGWMSVQTALYKVRAVRRSTVTRAAYKGFKGVRAADMESALDEFVDDHIVPRIYPEVLARMQAHVDAGVKCVIITTGMQQLVRRVLPYLPGGTEAIGCELEVEDGRFTGEVIEGPLYGQDKANIIAAYCKAAKVSTEECFAYTDHYSDYHMLQAVGHGVCINPASRLEKMAKEEGWEVLRLENPS